MIRNWAPLEGKLSTLTKQQGRKFAQIKHSCTKLRKTDLLDEYDAVIREQLEEGVVEQAPAEVTGREFFLPNRAVVRRNAEMTKLRVVYDVSACAQEKAPSLNDCLHAGPPLHNKLWSVVVRN